MVPAPAGSQMWLDVTSSYQEPYQSDRLTTRQMPPLLGLSGLTHCSAHRMACGRGAQSITPALGLGGPLAAEPESRKGGVQEWVRVTGCILSNVNTPSMTPVIGQPQNETPQPIYQNSNVTNKPTAAKILGKVGESLSRICCVRPPVERFTFVDENANLGTVMRYEEIGEWDCESGENGDIWSPLPSWQETWGAERLDNLGGVLQQGLLSEEGSLPG
ncbi:hypothetical protein P7K49_037682 [Saguinus oedipus]|uniref:Uncharacterized protein n=1 Tax=Saguinus oedipus TaxID=9490 RepID=A0ABQ9TIR3_SAGOE|nr:hypothetical protein P7K49_037682 [Saguinus oedipus]